MSVQMNAQEKIARIRRNSRFVLVGSFLLITSGALWSRYGHFATGTGIFAAFLGLLLLLFGCVFIFPELFTYMKKSEDEVKPIGSAREYLALQNDIRGTLLQVVLGIGILAAAVTAWNQFIGAAEQLQLTREQFISGQFSSATDLLSKPQLESRIGGLYTFQRLTRAAKDDQTRQDSFTAYQLLAAFVKAHSPWPPLSSKDLDQDQKRLGISRYNPLEIESLRKRSPDVQLALEIVGTQQKALPPRATYAAFLPDADLRGATLAGLNLSGADLRGTVLDYSNSRIRSRDPRFRGFQPANFTGADLRGASLRCAHLEGAEFGNALLNGADLRDADLRRFPPQSPGQPSTQSNANLKSADLEGAVWNAATQWPDDFDPAKDPDLSRKLRLTYDDELLAQSADGTQVLLIKGGTLDSQEHWEGAKAVSNPIVRGGSILGMLNGKTWSRLRSPQPLEAEVKALTCGQYGRYWPGSAELPCPSRPDRACLNLSSTTSEPKPKRP